jgi:hypothetical protein
MSTGFLLQSQVSYYTHTCINTHDIFVQPPPSGHSSGQESTLPSSPPSVSTKSHFHTPDYSRWREDWWCRFLNHLLVAGSRKRSWWWQHGYRLKRIESDLAPASRYVWVYATCVARSQPPPVNKYAFVASTGRSIEHHLLSHRIRKPMADVTAETTGRRTARTSGIMAQYLNIHTSNPQHRELLTNASGAS